MKKTNFIVVFWLLLALISFVVFVINFSGFWDSISYLIFPSKEYIYEGNSKEDLLRKLIQVIPMIVFTVVTFIIGIKQGLKNYNQV
ncbi:hypothetical protein [Vagococcus carniphilus]|uniref:hypothetical protein n=1 Tax=Vagococcus carniphilus TaxID=218144 RepID=UPI003B5CBB23